MNLKPYYPEECTLFMHYLEPKAPDHSKDAEKVSLDSDTNLELETLLEELAEVIEAEQGLLTP